MSQSQAHWTGGLGSHPAQGDRVGRYHLQELIGAGGLATVFRALDERGAAVAVKVLNPARVLPEEVKRFTREYRALSRMDHENIVRVYEAGVHQGYPWIAMEYVDGTDLDTEIERWKAEDPKDRWDRILRILRGLCKGLAYVHDLGLIHRDLKPSNVLLTRDGDAKISDFGVVKSGDNSQTTQLTMAGRLVGTVAFMAPELITDEGVDRRADLYALGAVLYLMCTYCRPIEADSVAGYLARHITEVPRPIGEIDPGAPPVLERVCARLLQKDRAYRYPSAMAILQALDRPEDPDAPPLRGRDEVQTHWTRILLGLQDGTGGLVALIGQSGSGRTHLVRALIDQVHSQGITLASASGDDRPARVLREGLESEGFDRQRADRTPGSLPETGNEPVVLTVDDLDLADEEDVRILVRFVRQRIATESAPILLLFTASDTGGALSALIGGSTGVTCDVVELGPVEPKSVVAMLRDRGVTGPVAPLLARRLHADYAGMPGPMMLQVDAMVTEGWLIRAGDLLRPGRPLDEYRRADLPVPSAARDRIVATLDALDEASRELCEMLAILDRPASPALLERCRASDPETPQKLDALVEARILVRTEVDSQEQMGLQDPCAARVIRARLDPAHERHLHAVVAEALGARKRRANALEVAGHLRAAGDGAAAYPLYVQAARRAAREGRYGEVLDTCDAAEDVREAGEQVLEPAERPKLLRWLHLLRGEALLARRAWDEAVPPLRAAAEAARAENDPASVARTLGSLGRAHYRAGRFAEADPLLQEALSHAEHGAPERASALRALADIALRDGRLDNAEGLWNDAMAAAVQMGSADAEARARRGLAHLRAIQGRLDEAVQFLGQADDLLNPDGDYRVRAGVLARAIELDTASARYGSALYRAETLVDLARRHGMGERLPEAYALLADLLLRLGEPSEAEDAAQQSLVFAKATDGVGWEPKLRAARVLADLGKTAEAFGALPPSDHLAASPVYDPPGQYAAMSARLYAKADPARARDLTAWALARPPPLLVLTGTRIAQDAAMALIAIGQPEAARNAIKRGLKLLGAGGDGIRLELLIVMQQASPDGRVQDAIRQVVERVLPLLPPNRDQSGKPSSVAESFRARPGIRDTLGG